MAETGAGRFAPVWYKQSMTTTLTDLNRLSPADPDATPWVATPDGSWTRRTGAGINPNIPRPQKEGCKNAPAENPSA
jgi:hypothetical protein